MKRKTLEDYITKASFHASLMSCDNVRVEKLSKLGGGISNDVRSFLLASVDKGGEKHSFVLKMYSGNSSGAFKEYEVLMALENAGFSVPHVYLYEKNSEILGKPFIIVDEVKGRSMEKYIEKLKKEEKRKRTLEMIELFAKTLASLHKLKWENLNLAKLHAPKDEYSYAEQQSSNLKAFRNYVQNNLHIKIKDLSHPINWLQDNAKLNPCSRYSIVHGDYNPGNVMVSDDGRIIVIDWEGVEIGDPAADVGYAYHFVRMMPSAKKDELAEYFVSHYEKNFCEAISNRLEFYKVAAALKLAIFLNVFKHPKVILKNFGSKYIILYPFIYRFLENWKNYVESFIKEHTG